MKMTRKRRPTRFPGRYAPDVLGRLARIRTPKRAIRGIVSATLLATIVGGLLMHLVDRREYPTIGSGLWWSAQTVTTVGYGDSVPSETAGRFVAVYVMLTGVAFLTVVTAAITAALMDGLRGRQENPQHEADAIVAGLDARLARIEAALARADVERAGVAAHADTAQAAEVYR